MEDTPALSAGDNELIAAATAIVDDHTDDLLHTVGAAVRDSAGRIHSGINLAHFLGGPCAELVALATARGNGARQLEVIVAVGNGGRGVLSPCGRDRQILYDFHPDIDVIVPTETGARRIPVADLLPYGFKWDPDA